MQISFLLSKGTSSCKGISGSPHCVSVVIAMTMFLTLPGVVSAEDSWTQFRGSRGDGVAVDQSPPTAFGEEKNRLWKTELPGKAWSSPIVADGVIWLTTAIEKLPTEQERNELLRRTNNDEAKFKQLSIAKTIELKAIAVDLDTGKIQRTIDLVSIEQPDAIHSLNSYASPTPVIEDGHLYCHFGTFGTFAVQCDTGEIIWKRVLPLEHGVGPGSSPLIHDERLILIQDGVDRQYVTALNKANGETLWETDRPPMEASSGDQKKAYCTPVVATDSNEREQLLCLGSQWMVSYDSETGDEFWRVYHGKGFSVVPRPVAENGVVYFSTGYGKPELWAVKIDGAGDVSDTHVVWTAKKGIPAKPSPLLHDGSIYLVDDSGVAACFDCKDGSQIWKKRLGGKFSASPVFAGGHLYFGNHEGEVFVMTVGENSEIIQTIQLTGQIMASPAIVNDSLIVRTDQVLYRFGEK